LGLGPDGPALEEAAFRDPPVKGVVDAPAGSRARRVPTLGKSTLDAFAPLDTRTSFRSSRQHVHHPA
jgi:hypothetical protein